MAVLAIPRLLHALGDDRFGLLTLFWVLAGYFNILDLGLGRGLILAFSRLRPLIDRGAISSTFWTGMLILGLIGSALGAAIHFLAEPLIGILGVAPTLRTEAVGALRIVGWTMPTTLLLPVLIALPTALQKQKGLSYLRIPAGIASHLIPMAMVAWTQDLRHLLWANLGLRLVLVVAHYSLAVASHPIDWPPRNLRPTASALLASSSWMMLTNLLAPLLMNLDRLLISNRTGTASLASYAPAVDLAMKVLTMVGVSMAVLFPALGYHLANAPDQARRMYADGLRSLAWWAPPVLLAMASVSRPALTLWLGPAHGLPAGIFFTILLAGVLAGIPGQLSFAAVQASGDARRASFLHLLQTPFYALALWAGLRWGGLVAVAWIWSVRHACDSLGLHLLAKQRGIHADGDRQIWLPLCLGIAAIAVVSLLHQVSPWGGLAFGLTVAAAWIGLGFSVPSGRAALPAFARTSLARFGWTVAP